ncbi:MAG: hypothetical protein KF729_12115 [Sandaracinaceae bacterium]|nr:hypothetical protein [Sandaracinaceae bacterium]
MFGIGRSERTHYVGCGKQLVADSLAALRPRDLADLPDATRALFEGWRALSVPDELAWARRPLRELQPVLERASFDDRVYWSVRLLPFADAKLARQPRFGADGVALCAATLPPPLDWLARTFGTVNVVAEQSGSAPFGAPLSRWLVRGRVLGFAGDEEDGGALPPEAAGWVLLYEADGDVLCADPASDAAYWLGGEWTGEPIVPLDAGWRAITHFVLWRLLDGGAVRPSDLAMLAAAR